MFWHYRKRKTGILGMCILAVIVATVGVPQFAQAQLRLETLTSLFSRTQFSTTSAYFGKQWTVLRNSSTGLPKRIYGPGVQILQGSFRAPKVQHAVLRLIESQRKFLGLGALSLQGKTGHAGNTWYTEFRAFYKNIPLEEHSRIGVVMKDNGRVVAIKNDGIPRKLETARATISSARAKEAIQKALPHDRTDLIIETPTLWYWMDGDGIGVLTWRTEVHGSNRADPFAKEYFVHARRKPEVLRVVNNIQTAFLGDVAATAILGDTNDVPAVTPLQDARLTATEGSYETQYTDEDGDFSFPELGESLTAESQLNGRWSDVNNDGGVDSLFVITSVPGDNFHFLHNPTPSEFTTAETTAYYWTTYVHNWSNDYMGDNGVEYEMSTHVNIDDACDAYYHDGFFSNSINFYRANNGCSNTAHDKTVIAHEYGHAIDDGRGGDLDNSYGEGFGDAVAMNMTDQACTGIDFLATGTCLRDGNDVRYWPASECDGEEHCVGQVYAQFTWEFTKNLKAVEGESTGLATAKKLILLPAMLNPSDIPDAVNDTIIADDDDGDLTNGTPHGCEIQAAADSRKLPYDIPICTVYVDGAYSGSERGTLAEPFNTVAEGVMAVPWGRFLHILPGQYSENLIINKSMTIEAPAGAVTIGQ